MNCSRSQRGLPIGRWWRLIAPPEHPLQTPKYSGERVEQRDREENLLREEKDRGEQRTKKNNQTERMARAEINVFKTVKAPRADHQIADSGDHRKPGHRGIPGFERSPIAKMNHRRNHPRACR